MVDTGRDSATRRRRQEGCAVGVWWGFAERRSRKPRGNHAQEISLRCQVSVGVGQWREEFIDNQQQST